MLPCESESQCAAVSFQAAPCKAMHPSSMCAKRESYVVCGVLLHRNTAFCHASLRASNFKFDTLCQSGTRQNSANQRLRFSNPSTVRSCLESRVRGGGIRVRGGNLAEERTGPHCVTFSMQRLSETQHRAWQLAEDAEEPGLLRILGHFPPTEHLDGQPGRSHACMI